MKPIVFAIGCFFMLAGCAKHVTVRPPVSTSLGYRVFKALAEIHRYPVHVGVVIDPKLEEETIRVTRDLGTAEIPFGQVVSAKVLQVLSYKFDRLTLVTDISKAPPLVLTIALEGDKPSVGVDINEHPTIITGASTFDVVAKVDARIRLTLTENGKQVWVGHARTVGEAVSGGAAYGVMEGSSQATDITNRVTDELVADLARQMQRSEELRKFFQGKRL
ncbi:MAG TPA: hypothetical protein VNN77_20185 [candidate division Zixibacteria bacterium]|nr:hypothetical protein [candidate division Zixibacteria bacterium]